MENDAWCSCANRVARESSLLTPSEGLIGCLASHSETLVVGFRLILSALSILKDSHCYLCRIDNELD